MRAHRAVFPILLSLTGLSLLSTGASAQSRALPIALRCEFLENPLGVDVQRPRLSWQMRDSRRGAKQQAYRVLAASRPELLREGRADLWDSGRVVSDQSAHIAYGGPALASRQRVYWQVRIWDHEGKPTPYSAPAFWEMGLLQPSDWKAPWIGLKGGVSSADNLEGVQWIWYPEGDPRSNAPNATRYLRVRLDLPEGKTVKNAALYIAADNRFRAYLNGQEVGSGSGWEMFHTVPLTPKLRAGTNLLAISCLNDSGPAGVAGVVRIEFTDETVLRIPSDARWRTSAVRIAGWIETAFDDSDWKEAQLLGGIGTAPWGAVSLQTVVEPAPLLRKTFTLSKPVREARLYVTALGSYRLHLNGQRVGREILTPDWTDYRIRVPYQVYDVTRLLRRGENAAGAIVGEGWYGSGLGWGLQRYNFGAPPVRLRMQMHITYADGSQETILSDGSWKGMPGPILRSEIYAGETYDARKEQPGWDRPGFDDSRWQPVSLIETPTLRLSSQMSPPIRVTQTLKPKAVTVPAPNVYIFDMGQNMVGMARLKVRGPAGTRVQMRFAEILKPDGTLYTDNLRRAEQTDTYILRGQGEEIFEPHFTYHGFRYVEITGYPGRPTPDSLTGLVFHTDAPITGRFSCSDPVVNRVWQNIVWGLRGNLMSVPTDCPQRDERLGWMGDALIIWHTACFAMDLSAFTRKWMRDVVEAQTREGAFPDVAPKVIVNTDGAPAWGCAGIVVPYRSFRQYGDRRLLMDNDTFAAMNRWINYIRRANPDLIWQNRRNNDYGDWVPADSVTPKDLIATAFWAYDVKLLAEMAMAIGRQRDERRLQELYQGIRRAFIQRFVKPDGMVGNGSQTSQVLALHFGLVPDELRAAATQVLVRDIEKRGGHLSTGFLGTIHLMQVLSDNGRSDVAYRLLLNRTYPSWGYMVEKGATTIWERWNGDRGDPGMNSFNHYAFGAVGEWLFRYAAGLDTDPGALGFRRIVIRPYPDARLTFARAEYDSIRGTVVSGWRREADGTLHLDITIPANTTATLFLPAPDPQRVMEGGKPITPASGIAFQRMQEGRAVYAVGAGTYQFTIKP
jgi:alpha-L-rhamnosidase